MIWEDGGEDISSLITEEFGIIKFGTDQRKPLSLAELSKEKRFKLIATRV